MKTKGVAHEWAGSVVSKNDWTEIAQMSQEEITHKLYKEGKTVAQIARIRNIGEEQVKIHLLTAQRKNVISQKEDLIQRYLALSKDERQVYLSLLHGDEEEAFCRRLKEAFEEDYHIEDRMVLLWTIGEMNLKAFYGQLKFFAKHPHGNVRRMVYSSMGKTGNREFLPYVVQGFKDTKAQVRQYAVIAFGKIASSEDIYKVREVKNNVSEPDYVLRAVDKAIENIQNHKERRGDDG